MTKTVSQAEAALAAANAAYLNELEPDCKRSEGSGAQEIRRTKFQQSLQDEIARCESELEEAKQIPAGGAANSNSANACAWCGGLLPTERIPCSSLNFADLNRVAAGGLDECKKQIRARRIE